MFTESLGDDGSRLSALEPRHAEEVLANLDRGRDFIGRYITFPDVVCDLAASRTFLRHYAEKAMADTGRLFGIWTADLLVGGVALKTMDVEGGNAEVGCWLEPSATGRGLVTTAMHLLIDWAVEERGIHRIEWQAAAANQPSIAVARRLGMTRDSVLRQNHVLRGERSDTEIWSILAPEWQAKNQGLSPTTTVQ